MYACASACVERKIDRERERACVCMCAMLADADASAYVLLVAVISYPAFVAQFSTQAIAIEGGRSSSTFCSRCVLKDVLSSLHLFPTIQHVLLCLCCVCFVEQY